MLGFSVGKKKNLRKENIRYSTATFGPPCHVEKVGKDSHRPALCVTALLGRL